MEKKILALDGEVHVKTYANEPFATHRLIVRNALTDEWACVDLHPKQVEALIEALKA